MEHSKSFAALEPFLVENRRLTYEENILYYDLATACPLKSLSDQGGLVNLLDEERAKIYADPLFAEAVEKLHKDPKATPMEKRLAESLSYNIRLLKKMSLEDYVKAKKAFTQSNEMWRRYKPVGDFKSWLPYWKECIKWARVIDNDMMTKKMKTPYDAALDMYEPGETSEYLDSVFNPLRDLLLKLLPVAKEKQRFFKKVALRPYDVDTQRKLSLALLKEIHYDLEGGCLRESLHPFSSDIYQHDARITTKYVVEDWRSSAFSVIHEGGHALEFQNKPQEMYDNYVESVATAAICETHSRFFENIIARSHEFAPIFKKIVSETLDSRVGDVSDEHFYHLVNWVEPGFIRCDSDELTYSLHIIIRYEIERDLINGVIECEDVPDLWNKKYRQYLGVTITNNGIGCMQDIHWTDNEIGYFPSYALGNLYGAMIFEKMEKEINVKSLIAKGEMGKILDWLKENDYRYDWMDPAGWIKKVTGKELTSQPFVDYLTEKFGR
jgi:carboxypeptidase Taq